MMNSQMPVYNASLLYILLVIALVVLKPSLVYDHQKKCFKDFGMGNNKTILTLPMVSISSAIIIYFIFSLIESTGSTKKKVT